MTSRPGAARAGPARPDRAGQGRGTHWRRVTQGRPAPMHGLAVTGQWAAAARSLVFHPWAEGAGAGGPLSRSRPAARAPRRPANSGLNFSASDEPDAGCQ